MTGLPASPDLDQLRRRAKELKRAVVGSDAAAIDRVLAAHPHYVGRGPDRLDPAGFNLRDAQLTIAREIGFDSWADLARVAEERHGDRRHWVHSVEGTAMQRMWDVARRLGHRNVVWDHILIAILEAGGPAADVLAEAGVTVARLEERTAGYRKSEDGSVSGSAVMTAVGTAARMLAIGMDAPRMTDEHVLMALIYDTGETTEFLFTGLEVDPAEIWHAFRRRGVRVPSALPPVPAAPDPRPAWVIYFPLEARAAVVAAVARVPGIGFQFQSKLRPGMGFVYAPDTHPVADMIRAAVPNPDDVVVLTMKEAQRNPDVGMRATP